MHTRKILLIGLLLMTTNLFGQDPNFYIFLCFGQSNMEGQGTIQSQDRTVDSRFKVMEAVNCSNLGRIKGNWYTAVPPLCRCYSGLSPADYFGRRLLSNLPSHIKVGIINVSVAGCKIELFDKENYQTYVSSITETWLKNIIAEYNGNPYARLVEMAQLAQKDGVIKGILLHQGESNTGDSQWPVKVKGVYDNLLKDLNLKADSVPLLAGEVVNADQGGICASMNTIIARLPQTIPTSYVISSKGCTDAADNLHFNSEGYREIGRRYADKMLPLLGYDPIAFYEAECASIGESWEIKADATKASNGKYISVKAGLNSMEAAPTESAGSVAFSFTVDKDTTEYIYARLNLANAEDDSYWIKLDDGAFELFTGQVTDGWQWLKLGAYELTKGTHTLTIAYSEDGARMDKISISTNDFAPTGTGDIAKNLCNPYLTSVTDPLADQVTVFPNPAANGSFSLRGIESIKQIQLVNMVGETVKTFNNKGQSTLDIHVNVTAGAYMLNFKDGKNNFYKKIIIQ